MQILIGFRVLRGLKFKHCRFIPSDVLVKKDGHLVVANFGRCRFAWDQTYLDSELFCLLPYLAPEENPISNTDWNDDKADIWSIGTILYQMIFGENLYQIEEKEDIELAQELLFNKNSEHNGSNLKVPKDISGELMDLLKGLLRVDPNTRMSWEAVFNHKVFTRYSDQLGDSWFGEDKIKEVKDRFEASKKDPENTLREGIIEYYTFDQKSEL